MATRPLPPHMCPDCAPHGKHAHSPTVGCWVTTDGQPCGCQRRYPEGDRFLRGEGPTYVHLTPRDA